MKENEIIAIILGVLGALSLLSGVVHFLFPRFGFGWDKFWHRVKGLNVEPNNSYNIWMRLRSVYAVVVGIAFIVIAYLLLTRF